MSNEWYTPSKYIEAAREVMGSIDLDPASCALANQTVRATRYYTQEDDGLSKAWYGNVWLNPPYSQKRSSRLPGDQRSFIADWVEAAIEHYQAGDIGQAVMLLTTKSDAKWFQLLWEHPICFADHVVRFYLPDGRTENTNWHTQGHFHGTCFVYLGWNEQRFIDVFSQFGRIAKAVDVPVAKPRQLELIA